MKGSYLILMNSESYTLSPYRGAITILNGKPWYCTGLSAPTMFMSENEAHRQANILSKKYPESIFDVIDKSFYLSLIDINWRCEWLQGLRQEQQSLLQNIIQP